MAKKTSGFFGAPIRDYIRFGFGVGFGHILATIIFLFFGLAIFIGGYVLFAKEKKKDEKDRSQGKMVAGLALMGLGCVLGLGMGSSLLFESVGDLI